jgi:hypothetical protein
MMKRGQNAALLVDIERQLRQRIVRVQVGFGLTGNHVRGLMFKYPPGAQHTECVERKDGD